MIRASRTRGESRISYLVRPRVVRVTSVSSPAQRRRAGGARRGRGRARPSPAAVHRLARACVAARRDQRVHARHPPRGEPRRHARRATDRCRWPGISRGGVTGGEMEARSRGDARLRGFGGRQPEPSCGLTLIEKVVGHSRSPRALCLPGDSLRVLGRFVKGRRRDTARQSARPMGYLVGDPSASGASRRRGTVACRTPDADRRGSAGVGGRRARRSSSRCRSRSRDPAPASPSCRAGDCKHETAPASGHESIDGTQACGPTESRTRPEKRLESTRNDNEPNTTQVYEAPEPSPTAGNDSKRPKRLESTTPRGPIPPAPFAVRSLSHLAHLSSLARRHSPWHHFCPMSHRRGLRRRRARGGARP